MSSFKKKINFYGLIHYKKNENNNLNFNSSSDNEKISIYLKNAALISQQLKKFDINFILITNNKKYINSLLKKMDIKITLLEIKFKTFVNKNTHFYSCHFRVDIFRYFSKLKNSYSILIDLDTVLINKISKKQILKLYDYGLVNNITDNVIPAYGEKKILKNLKILDPKIEKIFWYGGDFFGGNQNFYKILYSISKSYQKKFNNNLKYLKNQTDELFISLSIIKIKKLNLYKIKNANSNKFFSRYWSSSTLHKQKHFKYYFNYKLLHLPADKIFIANLFKKIDNDLNFKKIYFEYLNSKKFLITKFLKKNTPNIFKKGIKKIL
ncbi:hypothetical protein OAY13_00700 [Candidatus Pelagibacter sp.]|nr:hypothetical protein [Candidatus Pelagibacter sp.]